jgi:hypothetical protein
MDNERFNRPSTVECRLTKQTFTLCRQDERAALRSSGTFFLFYFWDSTWGKKKLVKGAIEWRQGMAGEQVKVECRCGDARQMS